ncbi:MAG: hypothetical protein ACRCXC_02905 [Legionella sp.]
MKRFILCGLVLPFLISCEKTQLEYYDAGYYHSAQPRSEIYGFDERPHDYRHPKRYPPQTDKQVKAEQGHKPKKEQRVTHHSKSETHANSQSKSLGNKDVRAKL